MNKRQKRNIWVSSLSVDPMIESEVFRGIAWYVVPWVTVVMRGDYREVSDNVHIRNGQKTNLQGESNRKVAVRLRSGVAGRGSGGVRAPPCRGGGVVRIS